MVFVVYFFGMLVGFFFGVLYCAYAVSNSAKSGVPLGGKFKIIFLDEER